MKRLYSGRIIILSCVIVLVGVGVVARLFFIQIREYEFYRKLAQDQHSISQELAPDRGDIFLQDRSKGGAAASLRDLSPVAVTKKGFFAYAVPRNVPRERIEEISGFIAQALGMDAAVVAQRLNKRADPYEPLKARLSDAEAAQLTAKSFPGIELGDESWRYYSDGHLVEPLLGFVGIASDGTVPRGLYGIERQYDNAEGLAGEAGFRGGERDALGAWIPFRIEEDKPSKDGSDLVLTIDGNIQFTARTILRRTLAQWSSDAGTVIVMEPATGKVLAMVSEPSYDPNRYGDVEDISVFLNSTIEKTFEPGSVFKPVTMAAALNEALVTPQTTYTDDGLVRIGGYTIRNFDDKAYGVRTMAEVIELSLNTGVVYVERLLGRERFTSYVEAFGFGAVTGVDLPGELKGSTANLRQKAEINFATASFGQGISVTALQMTNAIAAIANDGVLMRPYVVEKIIRADGSAETIEPSIVRRVITPEASRQMTQMLVSAVRGKFEKRAGVDGYFVAGKTGTAQIPDPNGGGYLPVDEGVIHTFVGYAPAYAPRFVAFIKMDKPIGVRFAANSLTPAFHDLAVYLLNYFNVPPDESR
ncbi:MAG: penicillin-binding protein 2 [bacterium]|nr:penicillin-binding protein 2 [bacterium]